LKLLRSIKKISNSNPNNIPNTVPFNEKTKESVKLIFNRTNTTNQITSSQNILNEELNQLNQIKSYIDNMDDEIEGSIVSDYIRDSVKPNNVDINSELERNSSK
jgi:hypothetical protein